MRKPRRFLLLVLSLPLFCSSSHFWVLGSVQSREERPRDVLIVTIDTLRADRLGVYGYSKIKTPNLDRLAKSGVLFENATAQAPLTPPSHASIFTGTYPTVHQVRDTGSSILGPSHLTLAEVLKDRGWETAAFVGAAVLGRVFGLDQGFETYDDEIDQDSSQQNSQQFGLAVSRSPYRRAGEVVDRALNWLQSRSAEKPYFLWVHVFDPHTPYDPPAPFNEIESPYDGEVAYVDRELGRLFDAVRNQSAGGGTLISVLSDHGESLGEHGEYTHGVFLYESVMHIPWMMAGPGVPKGLRVEQQARTVDLVPTILSLLGIEVPPVCQGLSLVPSFSGKRTGTTYSYSETLHPKIHMGWAELRAIRSNRWKYIRAPRSELYDLRADPSEEENVIARFPVIAKRLENQLREVVSFGVPEMPEQVQLTAVDAETEARLRSLGYVSAGSTEPIGLTGEGVDPKDRVHVLQLLEEATTNASQLSSVERIRLLEQALKEDPGSSLLFQVLGEKYEEGDREDDALKLFQQAVEQDVPSKGKIYARMALLYGKKGRIKESIGAFEKAVSIDPTDLETQYDLAGAYLMNNQLGEAERILRGILVLDEGHIQARNSLGWLSMRDGRDEEARRHFEQVVNLSPDFPEAYLNLGRLHSKLGNAAESKQAYETFLAKAAGRQQYEDAIRQVKRELAMGGTGETETSPESEDWLLEGTALLQSGDFNGALEIFSLRKQADPLDARPYFYSGMALSQMKKLTTALDDLTEAVRLAPAVPEYLILYTNTLAQLGHDKRALDAVRPLERKESLEGLSAAWVWLLFDTHYRTGSYDKAIEVLELMSPQNLEDPKINLNRGKAYFAKGDFDFATRALNDSIRKQPQDNPEAYYYLGRSFQMQNSLPDAKQAFSRAVAQEPGNLEYLYRLGAACLALGESENAIRYLRQAEPRASENPEIYQLLGRAYELAQNPQAAREYFEKSKTVKDTKQRELRGRLHSERLVDLGEEALRLGDTALARRLLEEAIEVDTNNWAARGYLAEMFLEEGAYNQAYQHLVQMEKIDPDAAAGKYLMARYWYWQRNYQLASKYAEQLKRARPSHPELRNLLGNIYLALDRVSDAVNEYSAAVKLAPDRSEFQLNLKTARQRLSEN